MPEKLTKLKAAPEARPFNAPGASRQVAFHQLLVGARRKVLIDALRAAVSDIDVADLYAQLAVYAPADARKILAGAGVRDEEVFPTPIVLEKAPALVGYYRLLLGSPQKTFYGSSTGMSQVRSMEVNGIVNARQISLLPDFCRAMSGAIADLVRQLSPTVTPRDIHELPLLTIGSQFQGGNNNIIGKQATSDVLLSIIAALKPRIREHKANRLTVHNASDQVFEIRLASDPDVTIEELLPGSPSSRRRVTAIEIKGGTDRSNAHNRAGEAEKSHQNAKQQGYMTLWTIIHKTGLDVAKLKSESPTTDRWFDVAQVIAQDGEDWIAFHEALHEAINLAPG